MKHVTQIDFLDIQFGPLLRDLREKSGVSISDLARNIGYSLSSLSFLELGHRTPPAGIAEKVSKELDLPPEYATMLINAEKKDIILFKVNRLSNDIGLYPGFCSSKRKTAILQLFVLSLFMGELSDKELEEMEKNLLDAAKSAVSVTENK